MLSKEICDTWRCQVIVRLVSYACQSLFIKNVIRSLQEEEPGLFYVLLCSELMNKVCVFRVENFFNFNATHPGVTVAFLAYQMIFPLFPTYFIFPQRLFSFRIYLFINTTAIKGRYVVTFFRESNHLYNRYYV